MQEKEAGNRGLHITAADYEYSTLMQLMGVSVSKHLLDEHYTVVWANEFYYELIGWPKEEYEATFHNPVSYTHLDVYKRQVLASVVVNLFSLDGSVNQLLAGFGMDKINFLGSNQTFQGLIIGTDIWKEFGYSSVVYLAAITSIDPGLHEAAAIDGASWWKRVWNVTIPGMLPIILLMAAMNLTGILSAGFDQIYNLYSPIVYETGDVLDTYVYRIGLVGRQYSFGAAVGLCRSAVGMILLLTANGVTKKMTGQKIF